MNQRDLTVVVGGIKQQADYTCILTRRPCGLVPVTLRRMVVIPPIWIGWSAVVVLPLENAPSLAIWQYARMLRPYLVLGGVIFASMGLWELLDPEPGSPLAGGSLLAVLAAAITLWTILGRFLNRFEFVRLLRYSKSASTVTLRFSSEGLARQASKVLILSEKTKATSESREEQLCPMCGAATALESRYCASCGEDIDNPGTSEPDRHDDQ